MALTVTQRPYFTERENKVLVIRGTLAFSGSYATGGETWNLTTFPGAPVKKAGNVIVSVWGANGYSYGYVPSAGDLTAGKIKICTASNTELTAGAYPAGITGDTIYFEVLFNPFI